MKIILPDGEQRHIFPDILRQFQAFTDLFKNKDIFIEYKRSSDTLEMQLLTVDGCQ